MCGSAHRRASAGAPAVPSNGEGSLHMGANSTVRWASAGSRPWSSTTTAHFKHTYMGTLSGCTATTAFVNHSTGTQCGCTACLAQPQQYTAGPCQLSAGPLAAHTSPLTSSNGNSNMVSSSSRGQQTPSETPSYEFLTTHNFMWPDRLHCPPTALVPAGPGACASHCTTCRGCGAVQRPTTACMGCWACNRCCSVQAAPAAGTCRRSSYTGSSSCAGGSLNPPLPPPLPVAACLGATCGACCRRQAACAPRTGSRSHAGHYMDPTRPPLSQMAACLGTTCPGCVYDQAPVSVCPCNYFLGLSKGPAIRGR
jgi:hypothetical protein